MQIFVDADAFPRALQAILFRAAERVRAPLILVANEALKVPPSDFISSLAVLVPKEWTHFIGQWAAMTVQTLRWLTMWRKMQLPHPQKMAF